MDKFIRQLLLQYSKVILPDFGAITVSNEETGELMFQEHLTYDDGKLAALLESESNMDLQDSKNAVAKFIRELKYQIDKGEPYSIFQLGEFSKNENNEYIFTGNLKTGIIPQEDVEPEIITKIKENIAKEEATLGTAISELMDTVEDEKEAIKEELEQSVEESVDEIKEIVEEVEEKVEEKVEEVITPIISTPIPEPVSEKPKQNIYIDKKKDDAFTVKSETKDEPKLSEDEIEKEKRKPAFWILLLIILFLIGGGIVAFFQKDKIEELFGWNKFENTEITFNPVEEENISEDEIIVQDLEDILSEEVLAENEQFEEDEPLDDEFINENSEEEFPEKIIVPEPVPEPIENITPSPAPAPSPSNPDNKFHLIVGTFGERANAEKYVAQLKEKGLNAEIIGQYSGMHYVSGQSFATSKEANDNLNRIKGITGGAWLFKSK